MSHNSALTPASMLTSLLIQNTEAGVADDKKGSNSPCYLLRMRQYPSNLSSTLALVRFASLLQKLPVFELSFYFGIISKFIKVLTLVSVLRIFK